MPTVDPVQREGQPVEQVTGVDQEGGRATAAMGAPAASIPMRMNLTDPANMDAEMTGASHH